MYFELFSQYSDDEIKEDEMSGESRMHGGNEKCAEFWLESLEGEDHQRTQVWVEG